MEKLVRKDGKDLTPDQARKEQDRVNKEVLKISQPGYTNPDKDEITVARLLQIVTFSRPRRVAPERARHHCLRLRRRSNMPRPTAGMKMRSRK